MKYLNKIKRNLSNLPGKNIRDKVVVIESDDWGAIRMSPNPAYNNLRELGIQPFDEDEAVYLKNDCLESNDDLIALFDVLTKYYDIYGNHPIFTAVSLVANPDFDKIKSNNFTNYYFESVIETYKRYPNHNQSHNLIKYGINAKIFEPQFHGREHLNVQNWLKALQSKEPDTINAFNHSVYGITPKQPINNISYQAAFDILDYGELEYQHSILSSGINLFKKLYNYYPDFFIPTNGPFNNSLERTLNDFGIKFIGASKIQLEPIGNSKYKRNFHFIGQRNQFNQIYLTRNAIFEPSVKNGIDWVSSCLFDIETAFKWHKPAIISSHRVNFVGTLNEGNRRFGLDQLSILLKKILTKWPDVRFLSTSQLGNNYYSN